MIELLGAIASLKTFFLVLLIFGLAPGLVVRFISLAFHRDDPRRAEMRAELHAVPRLKRPLWVAEQLEVVICEGLRDRVVDLLAGRLILRWHITSGVEWNRTHPDTFEIPSDDEKARITEGTVVKLMFRVSDGWGERMWVTVNRVRRNRFIGTLCNDPLGVPRLSYGDEIRFGPDEVIDIDMDTALPDDWTVAGA